MAPTPAPNTNGKPTAKPGRPPQSDRPLSERLRGLAGPDLLRKRQEAIDVIAAVDAEVSRRIADVDALRAAIAPKQ